MRIQKTLIIATIASVFGLSACGPKQEDQEQTEGEEQAAAMPDLPWMEQFDTKVAYVSSIGEGTISAIDLENNAVKWTLKVSEPVNDRKPESSMGIAATPDGKLVFTGDAVANELVVVDATKREVIKRVALEHGIHAIDICPHGHWVWVAGRIEGYPWLTATTVFDVKKMEKVAMLSPALGSAAHMAWTPDSKEVWVASVSTNTAWVWDAENRKVLDVIPLVGEDLAFSSPESEFGLIGLNEIAISPDGKRAYAVGPEAGIVFSIDVQERKQIASRKVGERTHGVGVTRDGKEVWTANNTGTVTILDADKLDVLAQIDLSSYADRLPYAHIAFSLDGKTAYVSIAKDIAVIDVATRNVRTTIPFGYGTHEISLEDFYVANSNVEKRSKRTARNNQEGSSQENLTRVSHARGIAITATYRREEKEQVVFELSLDTHSGDVQGIDVPKRVVATINGETLKSSAITWKPETETSHHITGSLIVDHSNEGLASIQLEFKDIGIPSRIMEWNF